MLLEASGIGPDMRVLDLGTGLGHVAAEVADLVGPEGHVVGVDVDPRMLEVAPGSDGASAAGGLRRGRRGELAWTNSSTPSWAG